MLKSFRDKETAALFLGERVSRIPPAIRQVARRKLMQLEQAARSLSDLGARSEPSGSVRPFFRSFEENSRRYLTRRIGEMGRSPTGAVGAA